MDLATLRALVETDLPATALQVYLTAATDAVNERLGPLGPVTDSQTVHGPALGLSYPAAEVLSVVESGRTLDPTEYALRPSGRLVDRLGSSRWHGRVVVTYQRRSDAGKRDGIITALVKLDLVSTPGLASVKFGSWSESYQQGAGTYADEREALLASLFDDDGVMV